MSNETSNLSATFEVDYCDSCRIEFLNPVTGCEKCGKSTQKVKRKFRYKYESIWSKRISFLITFIGIAVCAIIANSFQISDEDMFWFVIPILPFALSAVFYLYLGMVAAGQIGPGFYRNHNLKKYEIVDLSVPDKLNIRKLILRFFYTGIAGLLCAVVVGLIKNCGR
jgi:hypothetical protein